jgi:hypothetical protein
MCRQIDRNRFTMSLGKFLVSVEPNNEDENLIACWAKLETASGAECSQKSHPTTRFVSTQESRLSHNEVAGDPERKANQGGQSRISRCNGG